jgi:hypothetical protein
MKASNCLTMFFKKIPHHGIFFFEITTTVRKDVARTEFHRGVWSDGKYFHGVLFFAGYYAHPASSTTISVFPLIFFFYF